MTVRHPLHCVTLRLIRLNGDTVRQFVPNLYLRTSPVGSGRTAYTDERRRRSKIAIFRRAQPNWRLDEVLNLAVTVRGIRGHVF